LHGIGFFVLFLAAKAAGTKDPPRGGESRQVTRSKDGFDLLFPTPQELWTDKIAGHPKGESATKGQNCA
jgi:hypothetical protein